MVSTNASFICNKSTASSSSFSNSLLLLYNCKCCGKSGIGPFKPSCALPETGHPESILNADDEDEDEEEEQQEEEEAIPNPNNKGDGNGNSSTIISSCLIGLLTGIAVVLFNTAVHEIRDYFWDGIPSRGASWLREEPFQETWKQVIFVPACGGLIVSFFNLLPNAPVLQPSPGISFSIVNNVKAALPPFFKALAACFTLGTGNSLGPEGPSVKIGTSIAKGVSATLFDKTRHRNLSLVAAGSAAGISSGFNAAVAGCFFAVESVLWPSSAESSSSLTNTTSMVILSAVIASVVSEVGLGSEPAFKVPEYDFRSPSGNV